MTPETQHVTPSSVRSSLASQAWTGNLRSHRSHRSTGRVVSLVILALMIIASQLSPARAGQGALPHPKGVRGGGDPMTSTLSEKHIQVTTRDGVMETFVAHPVAGGPHPVVVIYMDAPGIRGELRDFARRIAAEGYWCALPDMYYRRGRVRFDVQAMRADDRSAMFGHMRSLDNALVLSDTEGLVAALEGEAEAAPGPMGCIGYCMSGQFIMSVAGTFPERFRASISCYGVSIVTDKPDTPHRLAEHVQGEMLFAFAEKDEYVPEDVIDTLRSTLDEHGVTHHTEVYAGTEHGFCFPERTAVYAKAAAEDVWKRSFAMFARQLKA